MDTKTMEQVGDFLNNATPEQLEQIAKDMVEKAPHLIPLQLTDKEKAVGIIKIHLAQLADSPTEQAKEYYLGYVQGLVAGAYVTGVLDDDENEHYHHEADRIYNEVTAKLKVSN